MNTFALLALLAASTSVDLVDENYKIAPSKWNYVEVNLRQRPALVNASFQVESGPRNVRLALMTRVNLENLREDLPHGVLALTEPGPKGEFSFRVREPGDYAVVIDNRNSKQLAADVHLRVSLDFSEKPISVTTGISRGRQLAVIFASFLFFFGVVTFAGRKIMAAIHR